MTRPIHALLNLSALRNNFAVARAHAGHSRLWAVVKANAYGHGLERVARVLGDVADGFALIEIERAVALREAGFEQPLLLLEGFYAPADLADLIHYRLIPVIHRGDQIEALLATAWPRDLPVYLKLNTGMNRLGFDAAGLAMARRALAGRVDHVVLMTHFADADGPRGVDWQLTRFEDMTKGLTDSRSLANSAALLGHAHVVGGAADWARPGIMLYGGSPFPQLRSAADLGLLPVMTLQSEIIGVQTLAPGDSVGYGCAFTADRPMSVGIVACGYADGYPRHAATGTPILVEGRRTHTLGRVSMDKLCVDLTALKSGAGETAPAIGVGSHVTLWGDGLPADAVAAAAGTISYELFCALARRVPLTEIA